MRGSPPQGRRPPQSWLPLHVEVLAWTSRLPGSVGGCGERTVLRELVEQFVFLAGVRPVLELDDVDLVELLGQPEVVAVEQAELLAIRHDLREEQLLERIVVLVA